MLSENALSQVHPYDEALSYHLVNLALVGEIQPIWESSDPKQPDLDDLFAIPQQYYPSLFIGCKTPTDEIYDDIQGYIRNQYEWIGTLRIGEGAVSDFEEHPPDWTASEIKSIEDLFRAMSSYSQRVAEEFNNNLRYNFSRLVIGYALRSKADGHGIIALRGTVSPNEWLNNLNYQLVPFHLLDAQYGSVHNGFRNLYKGIRGRYRELVELFDVKTPLYLVGHSLGAALSQLGALDVAIKWPERARHLRVYNYAAPRVGDATFAATYDRLIGTSYQIINVCDVVPYLPFEELGALLKQQGYPYADTKGVLGFVHQAGNLVANHTSSYHIATRMKVPAPIDASVPRRLS